MLACPAHSTIHPSRHMVSYIIYHICRVQTRVGILMLAQPLYNPWSHCMCLHYTCTSAPVPVHLYLCLYCASVPPIPVTGTQCHIVCTLYIAPAPVQCTYTCICIVPSIKVSPATTTVTLGFCHRYLWTPTLSYQEIPIGKYPLCQILSEQVIFQ